MQWTSKKFIMVHKFNGLQVFDKRFTATNTSGGAVSRANNLLIKMNT